MIYQADKDRAHYLNHTAVLMLELCDSRRSSREIPELVKEAYSPASAPRGDVDQILAR